MAKIAVLADVHGNITALEAVLADAEKAGVTEYWFLGDLFLPGLGGTELFTMLDTINTTAFIRGNWDDCFLAVLDQKTDIADASDIYIAKVTQAVYPSITEGDITRLRKMPIQQTRTVEGLVCSLTHNLPTMNYGGKLIPAATQDNFDALFVDSRVDIAIYAHVHHQTLRYASDDRIIINPGSVGQPFNKWASLRIDQRAQYVILEIDSEGIKDIDFRKVMYDKDEEYAVAKQKAHPYLELYNRILTNGETNTHNIPLLTEINEKNNYTQDIKNFFDTLSK